ncbi:alcohol dehydrogenase catalytic domain-containing protein [Novosphingobium piscinae]|uniref:Alcohol dehydrogenase catalytic domain-containing protein n=1 Tax=Novosphingobium piscinae TaxID=1507448 RepID=A0A7X1FZS6_9SPHN|nr:alcohol dehydrogenase catalytic domain-containing protein [Novosphingobium piscinae]MBC2669864.1 alcohol dehydrogenase catalytic domain-containing protein [Novosphingobium piscinae]
MTERRIAAAVLARSGDHARPYGASAPLAITTLDLADPRPGEVLVRIDAAGICHSDLSVINGDRPRPMPMALGHEAAGTVLALGDPDEPGLAVGDRVVLVFLPSCGQCPQCLSGEGYLCAAAAAANGRGELIRGGSRLTCRTAQGDHAVHHHLGVSAFATQAVVDRRSLVKVDADIPPETAALFGCAVLTGVGAVMNTARVRPGESVTVYGLGGVGLAALLGALASGAQPVHAIDPAPEKRALALELGAASALAPEDDAAALGSDVVIETVGKSAVLARAYAAARRGGRVVTVGLPNPAEQLSINALSLVAEGKTLMGSYMGSSIPSRDIPRYIALWRAGRLPVERLLSSVGALEDINELMDRLAEGKAIRQVIVPDW